MISCKNRIVLLHTPTRNRWLQTIKKTDKTITLFDPRNCSSPSVRFTLLCRCETFSILDDSLPARQKRSFRHDLRPPSPGLDNRFSFVTVFGCVSSMYVPSCCAFPRDWLFVLALPPLRYVSVRAPYYRPPVCDVCRPDIDRRRALHYFPATRILAPI